MQDIYLVLLIVLFILAIADLIVGVSNDAVNFLNSAIGSRVATRNVIMIVASLGIFIGATFSSGIMEIARKGIFFPHQFVFSEVMIIFLAVMITDIILLDLFNTFGLPTSTTVSIVFELLGAAFAISLIKITNADLSLHALEYYINTNRAFSIISGIFVSVAIAFTIGALVMYLSRILFSFQYHKRLKFFGGVWAGLSLAALTYFLLVKGVKGASFITEASALWVQENTIIIMLVSLIGWSIVMQILYSFFNVNPLKIIVLFGTFALAMAFAGNDLVNFIGVPLAGMESFVSWSSSGESPQSYVMSVLNEPVKTKTFILLGAGLVMVITLWFSKKARTVTDTEVSLGRQDEGSERFKPNAVSRSLVKGVWKIGNGVKEVVPNNVLKRIEKNFQTNDEVDDKIDQDKPAFDLVRASVNLTIASVLISFATSLKLPLSTTYVSFMVAMGTSLSDKAWGRDSAVYRVSGVLSVILGWFITAVIAFSAAALFAYLIHLIGLIFVPVLLAFAGYMIYRSFRYHSDQERAKAKQEDVLKKNVALSSKEAIDHISLTSANIIERVKKIYNLVLEGLSQEKEASFRKAWRQYSKMERDSAYTKSNLYDFISKLGKKQPEASKLFLLIYDMEQDLMQSTKFVLEKGHNHVRNIHNPLQQEQIDLIFDLREKVIAYFKSVQQYLETSAQGYPEHIVKAKNDLMNYIDELTEFQVKGLEEARYTIKNSNLFFSILLETKDLVAISNRFAKTIHRSEEHVVKEKQQETEQVT